ncbi:MAG: hypothetical protein OEM52_10120 [bacterium]|nr:hypothetical protein [bacterium]
MKNNLAILLCGLCGLVIIAAFFLNSPVTTRMQDVLTEWVIVLAGFSYLMGGFSILISHSMRISRRAESWFYSLVLISCLVGMASLGIFVDNGPNSLFQWLFANVQNPMQATMFSLLAFYVTSASYRAFRVKTWLATLLLISALLVMIGKVPIGEIIWSKFPIIAQWILTVPSLAAQRALLVGSALGLIATGLKTLLGIERSWLGR